jgi:hypothetical protein
MKKRTSIKEKLCGLWVATNKWEVLDEEEEISHLRAGLPIKQIT